MTEGHFLEHAEELRMRLIKAIVAVFICSAVVYFNVEALMGTLIRPIGHVIFTSPADAFTARLTCAFFGGVFLALPFVAYQIWTFVAAGLNEKEKSSIQVYGPLSYVIFLLGVAFAYFLVIPISIKFLLSFSSEILTPMITVKSYLMYVWMMMVVFGGVFELPIILMFLTKIGIATPAFLADKRKYAVVTILTVSALITPPDVITQLILSFPLIILYEVGIMASKAMQKKK